jgi:hypothetical protein
MSPREKASSASQVISFSQLERDQAKGTVLRPHVTDTGSDAPFFTDLKVLLSVPSPSPPYAIFGKTL